MGTIHCISYRKIKTVLLLLGPLCRLIRLLEYQSDVSSIHCEQSCQKYRSTNIQQTLCQLFVISDAHDETVETIPPFTGLRIGPTQIFPYKWCCRDSIISILTTSNRCRPTQLVLASVISYDRRSQQQHLRTVYNRLTEQPVADQTLLGNTWVAP